MHAILLAAVDRCAELAGLLQRPFSDSELIEAARRQTGFDDFGDESFREPLRLLLRCYAMEAELSLIGRMAVRWDVLRFLGNLLRLADEERAAPSITALPVRAPVFITGLPRSGTTFLHSLLAEDPANLVPRYWQPVFPYPPRDGPDRRIEVMNRQLRLFAWLAPDFPKVHPISATSPQECSEITAHVFRSLRFDTTHSMPRYREWLDSAGHLEAFRFHKRFLQHLQRQAGSGQWVVKCPDHIFAMPAIRAVYPDARFVFVHRDPTKVLASVTRLTEIVRRPFTRRLDRRQLGRQESDRWADGAARLIRESESDDTANGGILHVQYTDLVGDPIQVVMALYRHFGMSLSVEAEAAIGRAIAATAHWSERGHTYRMEDFGLDPNAERRRFAEYIAHFRIDPETTAKRRTHVPELAA
jgi:hypothetical protein